MNTPDIRSERFTGGPRLQYNRITQESILEAVTAWQHPKDPHTFRLTVEAAATPTVVLYENERVMSQPVDLLIRTAHAQGLTDPVEALNRWVADRPVCDASALNAGIATLTIGNRYPGVHWRVVVPRPGGVSREWLPSMKASNSIRSIREAALARSRSLTYRATRSGDVTVWVAATDAAVSSGVLSNPQLLRQQDPKQNLDAVVTPNGPVAVGERNVMRRLAEETNEPYACFAISDASTIGWGS